MERGPPYVPGQCFARVGGMRGEITLELDDGQKVSLRQGDCVVQNGTRHRWRNPLPEPCLMAFISIGGKRG